MLDVDRNVDPVTLLGYTPIFVLVIVGVSWYFEANGIRHYEVFPDLTRTLLFDPVYHTTNAFLHFDRSHFVWNMRLLVPFGILLTWLTSNRHVFVIAVVSQLLANILSGIAGQFVFGASGIMLAMIAASLVRSIGAAMQDASAEMVQTVVGSVLSIASLALFVIFLGSGGSGWIAHFHHFLGFTFGGAIEAVYVFSEFKNETERTDRRRSRRIAR